MKLQCSIVKACHWHELANNLASPPEPFNCGLGGAGL